MSIAESGVGGGNHLDGQPRGSLEAAILFGLLSFGAEEVWVVYPDARRLRVYTNHANARYHTAAFPATVLNGEQIDLGRIFAA